MKADQPNETKTFGLQHPIKVNDKERAQLTFRLPTFGDVIASENASGQMTQAAIILASACTIDDITVEDIKALKVSDVAPIMGWLTPLLDTDGTEAGAN